MSAPNEMELLEPRNRSEWRAWLERNAGTAPSVWLTIGKKGNPVTSLTYEQALEEALCFGWIDSTARRLDEHRYRQLFARRKPSSIWSRTNKERVARLEAKGKMAPAGLAAIEVAKANGSWNALDDVEDMIVPRRSRPGAGVEPTRARALRVLLALGAEGVPLLDQQREKPGETGRADCRDGSAVRRGTALDRSLATHPGTR